VDEDADRPIAVIAGRRLPALMVVALVLAGCGGSASSTPTTPALTITALTSNTATTTTQTATTAACPAFTDTDLKSDGFPDKLSTLIGAGIRTETQPCSERVVLELQGSGDFPGWWVRYQLPPLIDDPRGQPVAVAGSAYIVVTIGSWMTTMEGEGYHGPTMITPTNVSHIKQLMMLGDFESVTTWAIGLDQQRPFRISTLESPTRLVIDISTV
jgi:hypothetical protein